MSSPCVLCSEQEGRGRDETQLATGTLRLPARLAGRAAGKTHPRPPLCLVELAAAGEEERDVDIHEQRTEEREEREGEEETKKGGRQGGRGRLVTVF